MPPFLFRLAAAIGIILGFLYAKERIRIEVFRVTDASGKELLSSDNIALNESIENNASFVRWIRVGAVQAVAAIDARRHLATCLNTLGVPGLVRRVNAKLVAYLELLQKKGWFGNAQPSQIFILLSPLLLGFLSASCWRRRCGAQRKTFDVARRRPIHRASTPSLGPVKESSEITARSVSAPLRMTPRGDNFLSHGQELSVYFQHHSELDLEPAVKLDLQIAAAKVIQRWVRTKLRKRISKAEPSESLAADLPDVRGWAEHGVGAVVAADHTTSKVAVASLRPPGCAPFRRFSAIPSEAENVIPNDTYHRKEDPDDRSSQRARERREAKLCKGLDTNISASFEIREITSSKKELDSPLGVSSRTPVFLVPRVATTSSRVSSASLRHRQFDGRLPDPRMLTCGELRQGPAAERIFGDLLRQCKHGVPVTFEVLLQEIGADSCLKICESYCSEVFRVGGSRGRAVIKVFHFDYLVRHHELLLTEIRIARALRGLTKGSENYTSGLSELRDAYCVWGKFAPMMTEGCRRYRGHKSSVFTEEERDFFRPYVVLYMSFAGHPLDKFKFQGALQLRSVVQQVALTLAVGEAALQFEHRALTPRHVLVKEVHVQATHFRLDGRPLFVETFGVQASVMDFSAARLLQRKKADSVPLFADLAKLPKEKHEALGDTFGNVYAIVSEDPSQFSPWTNLAYLQDLISCLITTYDGRLTGAADELERKAWCDLRSWLNEMPRFASARDFVHELIVPGALSSSSLTTV